jgi:hypothetical protein
VEIVFLSVVCVLINENLALTCDIETIYGYFVNVVNFDFLN